MRIIFRTIHAAKRRRLKYALIIILVVFLGVRQVRSQSFDSLLYIIKSNPSLVQEAIKNSNLESSENYSSDDIEMLTGKSYYYQNKFDSAAVVFKKLEQEHHFIKYTSFALFNALATTALFTGDLQASRTYALQAVTESETEQDSTFMYRAYITLGNSQYYLGALEQTLAHYQTALKYKPISQTGSDVKINLGSLYIESMDYEKGLGYLREGLSYLDSTSAIRDFKVVYNNMATAYYKLEKLDSSVVYYDKYRDLIEEDALDDQYYLSLGYGNVYSDKGQLDAANTQLSRAFGLAEELENDHHKAVAMSSLGLLKARQGLKRNAANLFKKAEMIFKKMDAQTDLLELYELKLKSNLTKQDQKNLIQYQSLSNTINTHRITTLLESIKAEEKFQRVNATLKSEQLQNELLSSQNANKSYLLTLLVIGVSLIGRLFWKKAKSLQKETEAKEQLKAEKDKLVLQLDEMQIINQAIQNSNQESLIDEEQHKFISIVVNNKPLKVDSSQIKYITAEDNGCRLVMDEGSLWAYERLKKLKEDLPESKFSQVHRSHIIGLDHVTWVNHNSLRLNDGTELSIGRSYKEEIMKKYGEG